LFVWNFEELQKEIYSLGIKVEGGMFYPQEAVNRLLEVLARSIPVDEQFYYSNYPDVYAEVTSGQLGGAAQHFVEHGFYEGRFPSDVAVDEKDYLARYPDVIEGIESGIVESATDHWIRYGRLEGRTVYLLRR
jgi:hypothetical protein